MERTVVNPYTKLPAHQFWRQAVAGMIPGEIDPLVEAPFSIHRDDRVATAGSCFAQQLSRAIAARGFNYFVAEEAPLSAAASDEQYGVFSARYGNIYTTVQMHQLFERAYGLFEPSDDTWRSHEGRVVDPFRPRVQAEGFASADELREDRSAHLAACRRMFEACDVFVFTLGLTECWTNTRDGAVVPLAPGVAGVADQPDDYRFCNLTVAQMTSHLVQFVDALRVVNPSVRIVLTVSPVSITATYEPRHVVVSNGYSKAALRVVAEEVSAAREGVAYFPSFEVVQGPASAGHYLTEDRRHVTPEGVDRVMELFARHYLRTGPRADPETPTCINARSRRLQDTAHLVALQDVICDEEMLDP